jgi:hypothetical protein
LIEGVLAVEKAICSGHASNRVPLLVPSFGKIANDPAGLVAD